MIKVGDGYLDVGVFEYIYGRATTMGPNMMLGHFFEH